MTGSQGPWLTQRRNLRGSGRQECVFSAPEAGVLAGWPLLELPAVLGVLGA